MNDWQVESLRFTLFRTRPVEIVIPLWETLTREKPEKVDSQPRANIITEEGTVVLGSLTHISDPLKINWVLSPSQEQQERTPSFAKLSRFGVRTGISGLVPSQSNRCWSGKKNKILGRLDEVMLIIFTSMVHHFSMHLSVQRELMSDIWLSERPR